MRLNTLYSLTSKGQVQTWFIEFDQNRFRTTEGIKGGAMTESAWTVCNGKNLGKANETSPEDQAEKEARAKHKKKLESGYWENEADIHKSKFFEPMLAHKWTDYQGTEFPLYCSPKLDGARVIINKDGMFTRNGKEYVSCPHIWESVKHIVADGNITLDGELYNHEFKNNFNTIISLVKRTKPTADDIAESAKYVEFHVFDCFIKDKPDAPFCARYDVITDLCEDLKSVVVVENTCVSSFDEAKELFAKYIEQGYEGMMLRVCNSTYENKRSKYLLKYKEFIDEEFEVVDITEGKGNRAGMMGRFILKTKEGLEFEANARGNQEYYRQLLLDKDTIRGKMATVRYQNLTPDGKPRFGVCTGVRDWE